MAQFTALETKVEVNGETVLSIVNGMGVFKKQAVEILEKCGIVDPQAGQWYSQQAWLDAYREIADKIGAKTLFSIGKAIPANAIFPPAIDSIDKALSAIDVAYHMNHRNGEIGHYHFKLVSPNSAQIICDNPYPCDFDRGIIEAMANRFKPESSDLVFVDHDDDCSCRKNGGDSCTYNVSW